jgi:excisionase family DNA binding protein
VKHADPADDLLRPREAAQLFGVRPATLAQWSREGRLTALCTPGAHRRYSRTQINEILGEYLPPIHTNAKK